MMLALKCQASIPINPGLAGIWHNNDTPGQGVFIDVVPTNNTLFAGWFTYIPDNTEPANSYWLTLLGPYSGSLAELTIFRTTNGQFNTTTAVQNIPVGIASLLFNSCTSALFEYQLDEFNLSGSIELSRVTPDVNCSDLIDFTPPQQATFNYPPQVSQVEAIGHDEYVEISFDLIDSENDLLELTFFAVGSEGQLYEIPQAYLTGHVGYPVLGGMNKTVKWNYTDDTAFQALNLGSVKIKVVADDRQYATLQEIIDAVSEERLIADIQAIEGIRHHQFGPAGLTVTRNHIRTEMAAQPITVEEQTFTYLGSQGINLIGTLAAQESTEDVYIIDGHYDTVGGTPGADDNATGTAGMLEAMRVLSQFNSQKNIKFIGFDKEELGLRGSRHYAANIDANENIKGLINFEMIGYTCSGEPECVNFPNADTSIYNIKSNFADLMSDTFNLIGATHVPGLKITPVTDDGDRNFRRSDHAPFWDLGVDALFLTDGANFRTPHYHQASDRLSTLDTEFMTQIVKTAVGTLATLAEISHTSYGFSATVELFNQR